MICQGCKKESSCMFETNKCFTCFYFGPPKEAGTDITFTIKTYPSWTGGTYSNYGTDSSNYGTNISILGSPGKLVDIGAPRCQMHGILQSVCDGYENYKRQHEAVAKT